MLPELYLYGLCFGGCEAINGGVFVAALVKHKVARVLGGPAAVFIMACVLVHGW